jgi:long-chain acyl-CoA synthetase
MTPNPWTKHYPSEVSPELASIPYAHLPELLKDAINQYSKTIADFAAYLREVIGLKQGDRVAVQMPNCLAYPIVAFAVFKAGLVLVNTNPLYTAPEMTHQFADSGAVALIVSDMFADRLAEVLPRTQIKTVVTVKISEFFPPIVAGVIRLVQRYWSRSLPRITVQHTWFQEALSAGKKAKDGSKASKYLDGVGLESVAALQYTGGTTGVSKGAMLSHGNLVMNTLQMIAHSGDGNACR